MTKFYTHINRGVIDSNRIKRKADPNAEVDPPVVFRRGKTGRGVYGNEIAILDDNGKEVARIVYSDKKPILSCGARVVIISSNEPKVVG